MELDCGKFYNRQWFIDEQMMRLPTFQLFGNKKVEEAIQPRLPLRQWCELLPEEKKNAFQYLRNKGWAADGYCPQMLGAIEHVNHHFLRLLPGKNLHNLPQKIDHATGHHANMSERQAAALKDFAHIWNTAQSDGLVFRMLSVFAKGYIDSYAFKRAAKEPDPSKREQYLEEAFGRFDKLANCLNHIFEQFCVNAIVTRSGIVPKQEELIMEFIYEPTLKVLSDPRWKPVSDDISEMFEEYARQNYPETITKGHRAIQRFLQILVGADINNGKGELAKLFAKAKDSRAIPANTFTEKIIGALQGYISSERATNSTAKPARNAASSSEALLMMNVVMIFIQYCLTWRAEGT